MKIAAAHGRLDASVVGIVIERLVIAATARVRKESAVSDLVQPRGKAGLIAKAVELLPRHEESFLREIVCQRFVAAREPAQQKPDG